MPAKANSGRSSLSANQTTSFFLVSGFGLRRVLGKAVGRHQAAAFGPQLAAPMRRGRVADVGDGRSRRARRRRHAPAHHRELAPGIGVAHDRGRVVREDTRHRRQVADIAVDHAEQRGDRGPVGSDAVEIAHGCFRQKEHGGEVSPAWSIKALRGCDYKRAVGPRAKLCTDWCLADMSLRPLAPV